MSLEDLAAFMEAKQAQRDYRGTWEAVPYSKDAESSAWDYAGTAYRAWADITNDV